MTKRFWVTTLVILGVPFLPTDLMAWLLIFLDHFCPRQVKKMIRKWKFTDRTGIFKTFHEQAFKNKGKFFSKIKLHLNFKMFFQTLRNIVDSRSYIFFAVRVDCDKNCFKSIKNINFDCCKSIQNTNFDCFKSIKTQLSISLNRLKQNFRLL